MIPDVATAHAHGRTDTEEEIRWHIPKHWRGEHST